MNTGTQSKGFLPTLFYLNSVLIAQIQSCISPFKVDEELLSTCTSVEQRNFHIVMRIGFEALMRIKFMESMENTLQKDFSALSVEQVNYLISNVDMAEQEKVLMEAVSSVTSYIRKLDQIAHGLGCAYTFQAMYRVMPDWIQDSIAQQLAKNVFEMDIPVIPFGFKKPETLKDLQNIVRKALDSEVQVVGPMTMDNFKEIIDSVTTNNEVRQNETIH